VGQLAQARSDDGWFRPDDVTGLLETLRVPPGNVSRSLGQLKTQRLMLRGRDGRWSLTAMGEQRASEVMGQLNVDDIEPAIESFPGAELGSVVHSTLPPTLAPVRWQAGIARLLDDFPFDGNVFLMTRFPRDDEPDDPLHAAIEAIREALARHGLSLHVASDRVIDEDLLGNIAAHMWACRYGIGIFEDRAGRGLNYNVLIEIGSMIVSGRRCALLKDTTAPAMPTDLVGQIYKSVGLADTSSISAATHAWAADDLGLGRCDDCAS
jgi:hypothetical protein